MVDQVWCKKKPGAPLEVHVYILSHGDRLHYLTSPYREKL